MSRIALGLALVLSGCQGIQSPVPYYIDRDLTPVWLNEASANGVHRIPEFSLLNQAGERVTEKDFDDKVVIASFFFTNCAQVCPILKSRLSTLQDDYLDDDRVMLVSHSIIPEADSVSVLARYAERNGVARRTWQLLTGTHEELYGLARDGYFVNVDTGAGDTQGTDLIHTETILLLDGERRIRGVYSGTIELEMVRIRQDIEELLAVEQEQLQ